MWLSTAGKVGVISPATHPTTEVISGNVLPKDTWLISHGKDPLAIHHPKDTRSYFCHVTTGRVWQTASEACPLVPAWAASLPEDCQASPFWLVTASTRLPPSPHRRIWKSDPTQTQSGHNTGSEPVKPDLRSRFCHWDVGKRLNLIVHQFSHLGYGDNDSCGRNPV